MPFLNYKSLKLQFRVFPADHTVAMVTYCVAVMITTCSPMIGQFFDTMIEASSDKEWLWLKRLFPHVRHRQAREKKSTALSNNKTRNFIIQDYGIRFRDLSPVCFTLLWIPEQTAPICKQQNSIKGIITWWVFLYILRGHPSLDLVRTRNDPDYHQLIPIASGTEMHAEHRSFGIQHCQREGWDCCQLHKNPDTEKIIMMSASPRHS